MARMIPSIISPEVKSGAERKIFKWFQEAPGTDSWIVLHSLNLPEHETVIDGEADFVVIAPQYGIFVLEVKGGRVQRKDGIWHFTNRFGHTDTKVRGPFEQAKEAINSIITQIGKRSDAAHGDMKNVFYGYGVMVPDMDYESMGMDEEPWMVFDSKDGENVKDYIERLFNGWKRRWEETFGKLYSDKLPTTQDAKYLLGLFRRDFDKGVCVLARINNAEREFIELTEKQYKCIDQLEENRRGVVRGPAGTGKTLLAIKQAKTSVLSGKKVALICFNASIGQLFKYHFEKENPEVCPQFIGTFHKLMLDIVNRGDEKISIPFNSESLNEFYSEILPQKAIESLLENPYEFDEIIIDEAQDLMSENYIDVMDLLIKRGFEHGSWKFFGDFSRQAIYSDGITGEEMIDELEERTAFFRYKLKDNCRNTKQICDDIQTITGYESNKDLWTKVEGIPVDHRICSSKENEAEVLKSLLLDLNEKNIENDKITILSPFTKENSVVSKLEGIKIKNYDFKNNNQVSFSTIQSFKGLENSVIVLVDVDSYSSTNLMYVALSRAKSGLFILETKAAHNEYNELLKRRLLNG